MEDIPEISTDELQSGLNNPDISVIDVRSVNAYNGWKLKYAVRGGHIPGARSLPADWTEYMDWIEIVRSKDIRPDHRIVIYGSDREENALVARYFVKAGYGNVSVYPNFITEWANDPQKPLQQLQRYRHLVPPEWVNDTLKGLIPEHKSAASTVICHAHYRNREAYLSGHVPGAIDLDTLALESPETWNRRSPVELRTALQKHGITAETTVVLYGKFLFPDNDDDFPGSAAGQIGAIRCAFIMMYAGVKDVRVLNGGFRAWKDAGYEIAFDDVAKKPVSDFGAEIPMCPELAVDIEEAKKMLASDDADLICTRSWPEYIGEVSGYNYIKKKGRIPGAIFGNCGTDAYHMENYRNADHTVRETDEVVRIWRSAGISSKKHLAFYCGTGWRGSEAFFNAWLIGWPRVSVFDGGWFEWSNNPDNPYETGD